jgi:hypothetical protein
MNAIYPVGLLAHMGAFKEEEESTESRRKKYGRNSTYLASNPYGVVNNA